MNLDLEAWVLAAMTYLSPGADHSRVARAVATEISVHRGQASDEEVLRRAALFVAVDYRESNFDNAAKGDSGRSRCASQILVGAGRTPAERWTGDELEADPHRCAVVAGRMIGASLSACRSLPATERLAAYARGWCSSMKGRAISRDRSWVARRLLANVPAVEVPLDDVAAIRGIAVDEAMASLEDER